MSVLVCSVNDIGSAPNFSWSARLRASSRVKPPVMLARPSVIALWKYGATITLAVQRRGQLVLRRRQGHHLAADVGVLGGALAVERQRDLDLARHRALLVRRVAGGGVRDGVTGDDDGAEDVLRRAVVGAGDERLLRVVDEVVEGGGVGAVEGVELLLHLGGDPREVGRPGRRAARASAEPREGLGEGVEGLSARQRVVERRCCRSRTRSAGRTALADGLWSRRRRTGSGTRRRARSGRRPPEASARTGRNCICEDCWSAFLVSCEGTSGRLTTMLRSPCVVTSAPETPPASTRWTMMSRACESCSGVTVWPPVTFGSSTIWVPPLRSRPSLGASPPFDHRFAPTRRPIRARTRTPRMTSERVACERWVEAAPSPHLGQAHPDGAPVEAQRTCRRRGPG